MKKSFGVCILYVNQLQNLLVNSNGYYSRFCSTHPRFVEMAQGLESMFRRKESLSSGAPGVTPRPATGSFFEGLGSSACGTGPWDLRSWKNSWDHCRVLCCRNL